MYRPKHPVKVHVWAGGRTGVCIFDGIMDAEMYVTILRHTLLPFLREVYPDGHRMTPNIHHDVQEKFLRRKVFTGGEHPLSVLT